MNISSLDIFCQVIDNFGDAGVVYRLARALQQHHPMCNIRLFIDDLLPLHSIEPGVDVDFFSQTFNGITLFDAARLSKEQMPSIGTADIIIEAFACHIPECYYEEALFSSRIIINVDYLSAESWVDGYHLKESLLPKGTVKKYFFMPGFTLQTGGVLINQEVAKFRKASKEEKRAYLTSQLSSLSMPVNLPENAITCSVFSYKRSFDTFLSDLSALNAPVTILCFGTKTHEGMQHSLARLITKESTRQTPPSIQQYKNCTILYLPFIAQNKYDMLLCCTDFNIVRGEDSLVRGILAAKPFIWNAYLQDEKYQLVKVAALTAMMRPYFDVEEVFNSYESLSLRFNNLPAETTMRSPNDENFTPFLSNLKKIELSSLKLCYFIEQNCNLVGKLIDFIKAF